MPLGNAKMQAILKEYDQIVHNPMSSGLSKSCETALNFSKELKYYTGFLLRTYFYYTVPWQLSQNI